MTEQDQENERRRSFIKKLIETFEFVCTNGDIEKPEQLFYLIYMSVLCEQFYLAIQYGGKRLQHHMVCDEVKRRLKEFEDGNATTH